ncbi:hypothetical protein GS539_19245 [Rhodococcus hoagii]|nr:hypothetical protein [Prescottella equi]
MLNERPIKAQTLARLLAALPDANFYGLFEIVDESEARSRIREPFSDLLRTAAAQSAV